MGAVGAIFENSDQQKEVGLNHTQDFSSALSRPEKRILLDRIDELLTALWSARVTANNKEITMKDYGDILMGYVSSGGFTAIADTTA